MGHDRLSALDASFLALETPSAHMHVAWKGRFAARADGRPVGLAELRRSVGARVGKVERFRQRLAVTPGGLAEPVWVDDEQFDVAHHVGALGLAGETLDSQRFDELVDLALSEPLDRTRALWQIRLARLADGGSGLVMKAHHALVDGKSAVELALLLLDLEPDAGPGPPAEDWHASRAPGPGRLALEAVAERGTEPLRFANRLAGIAAHPARGARIADTLRRTALSVGEDLMRPAPSSYLNEPIGPRRRLVGHAAPLDELLDIKRRHEVKLNDVALAVVTGALRQVALSRHAPATPVKAMVPVSMRTDEEAGALGNRISFVFIELPVGLHSPVARLQEIHRATTRFKREGRASGGEALLDALSFLPGSVKDRAARLAASPRVYNLAVSNVPGPRVPVYLLGAELREAFPVVPLSDGHALSIGVFTNRDHAFFGCYADPTALPQVDSLPTALNAAVLELARRPGRRRAAA